MTIKASGTSLTFTEIAAEFGNSTDNKIGNYRVNYDNTPDGGSFSSLPLDVGIPQSGPIKFSDFYSKQLNIVVKGYGGSDESWANKSATAVYDDNEVEVVGGFKVRPGRNATEWQGGKTVKINVNKKIGSSKPASNQEYRCALKTGEWPADTTLSVDVGGNGIITGAGGDGGNAGVNCGSGGAGANGSSGLGIQYSPIDINIAAGGIIQNGYGGGGGGGGAVRDTSKSTDDAYHGGGGGGGGAGYPAGEGGDFGDSEYDGSDGSDGTLTTGGAGGGGSGAGGGGGSGGGHFSAPTNGDSGNGTGSHGCSGGGGSGGSNGDAIRATMAQAGNVNISNSGSIKGDQEYSVPAGQIT